MDERKVNNTISKASTNTATTPTSTTTPTTGFSSTTETTTKPVYNLEDPQRVQAINDMYDANINAQRTALQESGNQALSDAQANRDKIAQTYQTQRNMGAVNWERQRRNFMEGANMSGINTGAGSQAQLHMMGQQQAQQNALGYQQAQAETEANRNIADIQRQTQAAINEAVSKNDYQRAAALLDEYNLIYQRATQKAEALAQYGDFSGFSSIYGEDVARTMQNNWYAQNPDLAYMMGVITSDQRDNLKAQRPINDGLDENGVRIAAVGGGGYGAGEVNYYNMMTDPRWSSSTIGSPNSGESPKMFQDYMLQPASPPALTISNPMEYFASKH